MGTAEEIRTVLDGRWEEVRQEVRSRLDPETFTDRGVLPHIERAIRPGHRLLVQHARQPAQSQGSHHTAGLQRG